MRDKERLEINKWRNYLFTIVVKRKSHKKGKKNPQEEINDL